MLSIIYQVLMAIVTKRIQKKLDEKISKPKQRGGILNLKTWHVSILILEIIAWCRCGYYGGKFVNA